jgi:hypothetical protein
VVEVATKAAVGLRPIPGDYFPLTIPILLFVLAAIFLKNPRYHAFLALLVFTYQVAYGALISAAIG